MIERSRRKHPNQQRGRGAELPRARYSDFHVGFRADLSSWKHLPHMKYETLDLAIRAAVPLLRENRSSLVSEVAVYKKRVGGGVDRLWYMHHAVVEEKMRYTDKEKY